MSPNKKAITSTKKSPGIEKTPGLFCSINLLVVSLSDGGGVQPNRPEPADSALP